MIRKEDIKEIEEIAKKYFENANGCHDWTHVNRVNKIAMKLGKKENANLKILEIACFLHDIGRKKEMKNNSKKTGVKLCHAVEGAKEASKILKKYNFTEEEKNNIIHCIKSHRSRNSLIPKTLEANILFDADKIDSLGAIGVGRIFLFAGGFGSRNLYTGNEKKLAKLNKNFSYTKEDSAALEYEVKLKYLKDKMMTKSGKLWAKERTKFMDDFFKTFWKEINGNL